MPLSEAQTYLDHLGACSPCYREFQELQAKYRQRRTRIIFAVAASVLIVVGVATWAMLHQHNKPTARAVLDLRERSLARGSEVPTVEAPVQVPRNTSQLDIYLPLGSKDGSYDVSVTTFRGELLRATSGAARIDAGTTLLSVELAPPLTKAGMYRLHIVQCSSELMSVPLQVH